MMKKKEFKKQLRAATYKVSALAEWERKELLRVDGQGMRVIIHYLIWHIWSAKGLVKLCSSLFFYTNNKRVWAELPEAREEYLSIWVDYGDEPNDYEKQGLVKMVEFNPDAGFKEV